MYSIIPIHALKDNFVWTIKKHNDSSCICIDPGEASPVINFLEENNLNLDSILITHHHFDHTGGIDELYKKYRPKIYVPSISIYPKAILVKEEDAVIVNDLTFKVLNTPGHTLDHVIYVLDKNIFTGDTLFSGGCGRIFEGTYEMMYQSLQKICAFPNEYKIFCGHEYTKENLEFALTIDEKNVAITKLLTYISTNGDNFVTLPSNIG
ncbi:MAG: hydroxyacylglutathione hydrolase, partial [Legionellales bacterium]|nr:hydroxyacylglutathione hydrolase [Legionellales bacterium]